jgi:hypothetical protein
MVNSVAAYYQTQREAADKGTHDGQLLEYLQAAENVEAEKCFQFMSHSHVLAEEQMKHTSVRALLKAHGDVMNTRDPFAW